MKRYKTSKDYKRLKELLDNGYDVICIVPYDSTFEYASDVCHARFQDDTYRIFARGIQYCSYWPGMTRFKSLEDMCERNRVEYIDPESNETFTSTLTWQQLCIICETAAGMLGRNINDDLMCGYDSPQEFYEELKKELNG